MPRVQAIVARDGRVLMVKHRWHGDEWWCLPGGGLESGETLEQGALRELQEECGVRGKIIRQTSHVCYGADDEMYSFLVDIGEQTPALGHDPDVPAEKQVLAGLQWFRLDEIAERDRAFLWAAGLLGVGGFLREVEQWGPGISYPRCEPEQARFEGLLIEEGLKDKCVLASLHITRAEVWDVKNAASFQPSQWTAMWFDGDASKADAAAAALSQSLYPDWYCNLTTEQHSYVVFGARVFKYPRGDPQGRAEAQAYGRSVGVPESQLDWGE